MWVRAVFLASPKLRHCTRRQCRIQNCSIPEKNHTPPLDNTPLRIRVTLPLDTFFHHAACVHWLGQHLHCSQTMLCGAVCGGFGVKGNPSLAAAHSPRTCSPQKPSLNAHGCLLFHWPVKHSTGSVTNRGERSPSNSETSVKPENPSWRETHPQKTSIAKLWPS